MFAKATGNNCLFRITFDGIPITQDSIVEVAWVISIISVDSKNQPYEEVVKDDLLLSIKELLDRYGEINPRLVQSCEDIYNLGIYQYAKTDATQADVDNATQVLQQDLADLSDLINNNECVNNCYEYNKYLYEYESCSETFGCSNQKGSITPSSGKVLIIIKDSEEWDYNSSYYLNGNKDFYGDFASLINFKAF